MPNIYENLYINQGCASVVPISNVRTSVSLVLLTAGN